MIKQGYKSINGDYIFTLIANKVNEFKKANPKKEVVDFGVGDVKFLPPPTISRAITVESEKFLTSEGFCGYPSEAGIFDLRQKISKYYQSLGAEVFEDEVFITSGAKPAIGEIFELCNFKSANIVVPTYPLYEELCALHGVKIYYERGDKREYPLPKNKAEVLFLCAPNNPTGANLTVNGLKKYATYAKNNNVLVVLDGAYADFATNYVCPYKHCGCERIIEVRSYSKSLSFTGLRLGYMVIKKQNPIYGAYKKYLSLRSNGVNVIMQRVACYAYGDKCKKEQNSTINYYRENGKILKKVFMQRGFNCLGGVNAPYLLVNVYKSGFLFFEDLLNSSGVVVTPGEAFRAENQIRVSLLTDRKSVLKGAARIEKYLQNLTGKI